MPYSLGGVEPGNQGVHEKTIPHGGTVTGTTETVIAQIRIPAGCLIVGSTIEFAVTEHNTTTNSTGTLRLRIGSGGNILDGASCQFSTTPSIQTTTTWRGTSTITVIGGSAAHIGNAFYVNAAGNAGHSGNASSSGTFNSANAMWASLTISNGTSVTRTIRGGYLRIINP
jgi:hypothetical protein